MYIVNDDIPLGCVYEGENGKTKYCPMLNHDDVPYCQYLEDDEAAIGIDERPVYCPIVEFPYTNVGDTISRQAAIDAIEETDWYHQNRNGEMVHGANSAEHQPWYKADDVYNALGSVPTAGAVEVVRCKDCRYGHRFFDVINGTTDSWIECRNPDGLNRDTSEDSFCSCGERKDE